MTSDGLAHLDTLRALQKSAEASALIVISAPQIFSAWPWRSPENALADNFVSRFFTYFSIRGIVASLKRPGLGYAPT